MRVLGIETSCDETGIAIYDANQGLMGHNSHSQIELHAQYGGVVPELASRDHIQKIIPLIDDLFKKTHTTAASITGIAYTQGPGLSGALLVGATVGATLGMAWNIPSIGVHHMEGHLMAPMLEDKKPPYPFVALLVSGGHTQLIEVKRFGEYVLLGDTFDDAVGEAFDKTAKLLGLGYPGGAALAKLAEAGDASRFQFPRPMVDRKGLDFSFSGLKTFALNTCKTHGLDPQTKADIAAAFQRAAVETLITKCKRALELTGYRHLVVAGGVGANVKLRTDLTAALDKMQCQAYFPRHEFCTDNGAMIAYVGFMRLTRGERSPLTIDVRPRWDLSELA